MQRTSDGRRPACRWTYWISWIRFGTWTYLTSSALPDLPQLDSLPLLESVPGGIVLRGPVQRTIAVGEPVPGTDILLTDTDENEAVFEIAGLRSVRRIGDSLDYDGEWPGLEGVTYSTRLRIYQVGNDRVRIAGVQQIGIPDIEPRLAESDADGIDLKFPFFAGVGVEELIPGTTYGFAGVDERGADLSGTARDEYPYRKMGDSILWRGELRRDIPVEYSLRAIHYDGSALQVGGVVTVRLPVQDGD